MARSTPPSETRELGGYPVGETTLTQIPAGPPPGPPDPPPPARGPWPWVAGAAAVVLFAGLATAYAIAHNDDGHTAQTGRTVQQSLPAATPTAPQPASEKTQPKAKAAPRAKAKPAPVPRVVVPRLVGQNARQAVSTLRAVGLTATSSTVRAAQPTGTVIGQSPAAGDKLRRGKPVHLELSAGPPKRAAAPATTAGSASAASAPPTPPPPPAPPAVVPVPDLHDLPLQAARAAIRRAGLVTEVHRVPSHEANGTVVAQSPKADREVKRGSHVLLNVARHVATPAASATPAAPSSPPPPPAPAPRQTTSTVAVPDVVGQDEESAATTLEQAGLTVDPVDSATSDQTQDGTVLSQQPSGGSEAASGATVTITIGRYSDTG